VQTPDVYELRSGSIVQDAIDAAGGPTSEADLAGINLALALQDQQQVHVPREGETSPPPAVSGGDAGSAESSGGLININTATAEELEALPGVGEVTAQRIIEHREVNGPFERVEDIQDVSGIGEKTFEGMEGMITVGG
jgi:competence protein ComEA